MAKINGNAWLVVLPVLAVMAGFIAGNRTTASDALQTARVVEEREQNHYDRLREDIAELKDLLKER